MAMTQNVTNWNNYPVVEAEKFSFDFKDDIQRKIEDMS
jgi:hypothetical protein